MDDFEVDDKDYIEAEMEDDDFIELMKAEQLDRIEREHASQNGKKIKSDKTDKEETQKFPWRCLLATIILIILFINGLKGCHDILDVILLIGITIAIVYWLLS